MNKLEHFIHIDVFPFEVAKLNCENFKISDLAKYIATMSPNRVKLISRVSKRKTQQIFLDEL